MATLLGAIAFGLLEAKELAATLVVLVVMFDVVGKFLDTSGFFRCRPERDKRKVSFPHSLISVKGGKPVKLAICDFRDFV